jgi:phosphoinositide-3-kinase regulatory subunit 4
VNLAHGDLKIENILLTSYNWVLLSDFANFKSTFFAYVNKIFQKMFFYLLILVGRSSGILLLF